MIDAFVSPVAGWQPPSPRRMLRVAPPLPPPQPPASASWQEYAAEERWRESVIAYLRSDWRKTFPLWRVVNDVVRQSGQRSRADVRAASFEVLQEIMLLRREKVLIRYRKRWIAILDLETQLNPVE